uniref:DUF1223 domain-containing protein n=1 Tax=Solibacter usitatus (strain Ellin6076) TaxID=234267 RepID=Q02C87_SOLUE
MKMRILIAAALGGMLAAAAEPVRAPVLVELFTSEGCSSCPPADRLLETLDSQVVVLSEHVDYWDRLGWRDPYSSHASTLRQESYARAFGTQGPYTPQMVIDGAVEFVGNDSRRAADEIARARGREKVAIRLARTGAGVRIEIDAGMKSGDVILALADDSATSEVAAGENKGRRLHHVAIVRTLRKIGTLKRGVAFSQTFAAPADAGRAIVFVQDGTAGKVFGAAMIGSASGTANPSNGQ